jgi:hypothetical protein
MDSGANGNFYATGNIKIRGKEKVSFVDLLGDFSGKEKKFLYGKRFYIT